MEGLKNIKLEDFEIDQAVNIKFEDDESFGFDLKTLHGMIFCSNHEYIGAFTVNFDIGH